MTNHRHHGAITAVPGRYGEGSVGSRRHIPKRGQIKARIVSAAAQSVVSVLLKALHSSHILLPLLAPPIQFPFLPPNPPHHILRRVNAAPSPSAETTPP
ncbi:hypothetical protein ABZP36_005130 [Zizania latifolia]